MKRFLSFILFFAMLTSSLSVVSFANPATSPDNIYIPAVDTRATYIAGDADDNGEVNALDAYAVKYAVGNRTTVANPDSADVDADGKVTAADCFYLKAYFVGLKELRDFELSSNVGKFRIGGTDISEFEIVLPAGTVYDDNKYLGYEYLSKYLKIATGITVPLTYGDKSSTGHGIYFNTVDFYSEYGQSLGVDGYCYKVEDGNLYIYGTLRGNGYAVFDILERFLGFLYCASDRVYSYTKRTSDIPADFERTYAPQFKIRSASGAEGNDYYSRIRGMSSMVNESSWYNNAYIGYISGDAVGTVHSFDEYRAIMRGTLPSDEDTTTNYYLKAADGYKLVDTSQQVCATSDEAYDEIFSGMLMWIQHISAAPGKYFETEYGVTYASFGPSDNQKFCPCRLCNAIAQGVPFTRAKKAQITWVENNYGGEYSIEKEDNSTNIYFKKENNVGLYLNMINRAARDIQEYYPGLKVLTYFYPNDIPETIRPEPNVYLWYCGACNPACVKHSINEECSCNPGIEKLITTEKMLEGIKNWRRICDETGAELGYWCYFTNYGDEIFAVPNYNALWGTLHKLGEIGLDGVYYECGSIYTNPLEARLKVFLAQKMIWDPDISYEEFRGLIKQYLTAVYGDAAAEDLYSYILMSEEAMNENERCFAFWYKAFDIYSEEYMNANYEKMRSLLESAKEKVVPEKVRDIDYMLAALDLVGLSAVYDDWYTNGNTEMKAKYCSMYDSFYYSLKDNGFNYGSEAYQLPTTISYEKSPVVQIYLTEHQFN